MGVSPFGGAGAQAAAGILLVLAVLTAGLISGCYAHDVAAAKSGPGGAARARLPLLSPMKGRYAITRAKQPVGEETFTITSSGSVWRAEGRIALRAPVEERRHYILEIDETTGEPLRFALDMELAGEKQDASGRRTEGDYFTVTSNTIAGKRTRKVPYGAGTALELGSPLSATLVLSLLGPSLEMNKPVLVRTIVITQPVLEPAVMVLGYELRGRDDRTRRIAVAPIGSDRPIAMWVRDDGLPTRVRTWIDDGPPFELQLDP